MQLRDTLHLLGMQIQYPPDDLMRFAAEDTIGGYHYNEAERKWPMGSLFEVEGKVLYALVRLLKPEHVAEIGSLRGCSTAHMATALTINGAGRLTAIDIAPGSRDLFPAHLEAVLTGITGDGLAWLAAQPDASIDLLFEDSSHGTDMCAAVGELCKTKLTPGGLLIVHDAGHDFAILGNGHQVDSPVGAEIRAGLDRALGTTYRVYLSEPSDCGFAVWQAPKGQSFKLGDIQTTIDNLSNEINAIDERANAILYPEKPKRHMITEDGEQLEIVDAPPVEKPKRTRKKAAK